MGATVEIADGSAPVGPRGGRGRSRAARAQPAAVHHRQRRRRRGGRGGSGWARAAGSERTGLNWAWSADEAEGHRPLPFRGRGDLRRARGIRRRSFSSPRRRRLRSGTTEEEIPIRAGHVISRRPARASRTGSVRARTGMTFLAYGTRKAERHLLLPALEQDLLPRPRPHRPPRGSRLLRRRARA